MGGLVSIDFGDNTFGPFHFDDAEEY